jgi:transposase InsO family protein
LCNAHGIFSVLARKKGGRPRPGEPVHDDLVRREFTATGPDELWFTDITEHRTDEGKLYVCAIKDACSNRIVGYSIDQRMKASLAVAARRNAVALRGCRGTVVHSDRGSQGRIKRSSQHLDEEVGRWPTVHDRSRFACIGGRSLPRAARRWRGVRIGSGSGMRSPAV